MMPIESLRKECLKRQTELRGLLEDPERFEEGMCAFLRQHARLHTQGIDLGEARSLADEALEGMGEKQMRAVPKGEEHSVAWLVWHMARCEDITMNLLVAGTPQVLTNGWTERIKSPIVHTGNAMEAEEVVEFSQRINVETLLAYRLAVGRRTREIAGELKPADLKRKVAPERIQRVLDEGAVLEAARGIAEYWGKRTVTGLLLMPATRHNLIHLGEVMEVGKKVTSNE